MISYKCLFLSLFTLIVSLSGCNKAPYQLKSHFSENLLPSIPDYSKTENWASLPTKNDPADQVPLKSDLKEMQAEAKVDVFFLHPTIFTKQPKNQYEWNADVTTATPPISTSGSKPRRASCPCPCHPAPNWRA